MTNPKTTPRQLRVADLSAAREHAFDLRLTAPETEAMRDALDLLDLRKPRLAGTLRPVGKSDWQLDAQIGATVVQPCVATLEPVTTRIDSDLRRLFTKQYDDPGEEEVEMPEDDSVEPLGTEIDLLAILTEALSLALPLYPRADGAEDVTIQVTEPGKKAMTDEDARPFASLAALKDKLGTPES
ncbi:DUF177 domain-containing protein [Aliishimia ponticola]|uniref:DUF177 domain-containing protein n=1 Tax=Aliishimia ponticola TaxID=2499833 RepID=A0A4V3XKY7_9RHOB|nr:DUF177 domain-containing protein [Aliishimia ponticola]THH38773.1 DUF177 domain-containing protein [Aliishimia ponticola]